MAGPADRGAGHPSDRHPGGLGPGPDRGTALCPADSGLRHDVFHRRLEMVRRYRRRRRADGHSPAGPVPFRLGAGKFRKYGPDLSVYPIHRGDLFPDHLPDHSFPLRRGAGVHPRKRGTGCLYRHQRPPLQTPGLDAGLPAGQCRRCPVYPLQGLYRPHHHGSLRRSRRY